MPRQGRIDFPGAVHHIMVRGLNRRLIFRDERDRGFFLDCLGEKLLETKTPCFAWALMPNHLHLQLRTGDRSLSCVLQSVLTRYALWFNRRWKRCGPLFQGRFKSLLCQEDPYFLTLLRYIHLNPLRAGLVTTLGELASFPWAGHAGMMGRPFSWHKVEEALSWFDEPCGDVRNAYLQFLQQDVNHGAAVNPILSRQWDGSWKESHLQGIRPKTEECLRGDASFCAAALQTGGDRESAELRVRRLGWSPERIVGVAARTCGISALDVPGHCKIPVRARARAIAAAWLIDELFMRSVQAAKYLGLSQSGVCMAAQKGRRLIRESGLHLENLII